MTFVRPRARILELSTTSGNGPYALAGAADNSYNRFSAFMSVGDTTYATVVEPGVAFWTGVVTYSATNQITLTTVEESKGTFGSGTKEIFTGALATTAMLREDISGAIVTGGSAGSYTVASYRQYSSLAQLDGCIIAFSPHVTNAQGALLSVDGLAAKPLALAPLLPLQSNIFSAGTPYLALYKNADQAFYLHALGDSNAYGIPLAAGMDYWGSTTPGSAFVFPIGQTLSRTTYARLFNLIGTAYGAGDGSTTFGLPDKRGRTSAGADNMGGSSAGRLTTASSMNGVGPGSVGGEQLHTLTTLELAAHAHNNTLVDNGHSHGISPQAILAGTSGAGGVGGGGTFGLGGAQSAVSGPTGITLVNANQGGNVAHNNVQPTITCNYIMRVL